MTRHPRAAGGSARRFGPRVFCALALLLPLACGQPDATPTIEFWTLQLSPAFDTYITEVITAFERSHPGVSVRWVDVPYDAAIQKLLASAVAGNAPDVVNLSADFLARFHGMGALADLRPDVARCGYTFLPNALALCTFDSAIVALPWYLNTYVLLYNKALLAEAGFTTQDLPLTYAELLRFVREYKDRTGKYALFWNIGKDSYLPMMLGSEGVEMTDPAVQRSTFHGDRGIELVSAWVDLYRDGYLPSESIIKPGSTVVEAYQSGQVLMIMTGPVFLNRIRQNAPQIYARTGVHPAIVGATGTHDLAAMAVSVLTTSRHPDEAKAFALFLTNPDNQLAFSRLTTTYPSVVEALRDSFFADHHGDLASAARVLGAEQLSHATRLRRHLLHQEFDVLRDVFDESVQKACLGSLPTREAMHQAAAKWDVILRNKRRR